MGHSTRCSIRGMFLVLVLAAMLVLLAGCQSTDEDAADQSDLPVSGEAEKPQNQENEASKEEPEEEDPAAEPVYPAAARITADELISLIESDSALSLIDLRPYGQYTQGHL